MKPTSLRALISQSRQIGDALVVDRSGAWTLDQLTAATTTPEIGAAAAADAVALCFCDPLKLLLAILACDRSADTILLLPGDMTPDLAVELAGKSGAAVILTDRPDLHALKGGAILWSAEVQRRPGPTPPPQPDGKTRWIFATSGTTGSPKLVQHDLESLCAGLRFGGPTGWRWGQLYDIARFAGTQVMLQALADGVLLLPQPDWPLSRKVRFFAAEGCNALSATPTLWRKIMMTPEGADLDLQQATLGGEIADAAILSAITHRFPRARTTHIYASTEAGASFAVADGKAGFPAAMIGNRRSGPEIKVVEGRLFIRSARSRRTYLGSDIAYSDDEGFVDTGDMVEVREGRCLFLGRANGAINVGGDKLYPQEVEAILLTHPAVEHARVYARNSPITGQIVVADIVARTAISDPRALTTALRGHCAASLPRWKWPAVVRLVEELATESSGKIGRRQ